ncbi:MAG: hypothetical protein GY854_31190 [Deltaproteobacteria bacterium]|nr:hypothetical protein [Deltaproteobacteria bacterium]
MSVCSAPNKTLLGIGLLMIVASVVSCAKEDDPFISEDEAAEQTARTECEQLYECDCEQLPFSNEADCVSKLRDEYQNRQDWIMSGGLVYDGECLGLKLDNMKTQGCASPDSDAVYYEKAECGGFCLTYHGEAEVGQPCTLPEQGEPHSNCLQGLLCEDEKCVDPCAETGDTDTDTALGEGETCVQDSEIVGKCGEGLACDEGDTGTCVPAPGLGEACTNRCEGNLYCILDICSEGPGLDENCYGGEYCAPGLTCREGYCRLSEAAICSQVVLD